MGNTTVKKRYLGMDALGLCGLQSVALYFQALAEPTRLRIIEALDERPMRTKDLAGLLATSSANVSRHLAVLERQGIAKCDTTMGTPLYRIADPEVANLLKYVKDLYRPASRQTSDCQ